MEKYTYQQIKENITRLAHLIDADLSQIPKFANEITQDGESYIEINQDNKLYFEAKERGRIIFSIYAPNLDDLLYNVFNEMTERISDDYSRTHFENGVDPKRIKFKKKLELLTQLNADWGNIEKRIQEIKIHESMFDDYEGKRKLYLEELLGDGYLIEEALLKLEIKYPKR